MIGTHRIAGYAIVSADGMIADASAVIPDSLRNDTDQQFLQAELDRAAAIVHGRHSYEGGPRAARRRRLIVTRAIAAIAVDPSHPNALLWNPAGATIENALAELGTAGGIVAIIGGTDVFGLFLPHYDAFHLTRAAHAKIPGGRPVFPTVSAQATPEQILAGHGLAPGPRREIDAAAGIALITWERK
jgi:dihydrofolate reductase